MIKDHEWDIINSVDGYMEKEECDWIASMASQVGSWTEIGTLHGRSMLAVGLHLKSDAWLQVVDVNFAAEFWTVFKYLHFKRPDLRLIAAECSSAAAYPYLPYTEVAFIDSDHSYYGVKNDIDWWRGKCRYLCGHDYNNITHADVTLAINHIYPKVSNPAGFIWFVDLNNENEYK